MQPLNTRQEKINFLQKLHIGKAALRDVLAPIYGVLYIREGKVFARQDSDGYKALDVEIDAEVYTARHAGAYSHMVELVDFAKPSKQYSL
jgi:hypothetical protein